MCFLFWWSLQVKFPPCDVDLARIDLDAVLADIEEQEEKTTEQKEE